MHRWDFEREKQAKKEASLAAADADRIAFRSIDWHDFVVVEVRKRSPLTHSNGWPFLPWGGWVGEGGLMEQPPCRR